MSHIPERIGSYEVLRKLADGGMAELFLARGPSGLVALKRILPQLAGDAEFVTMFEDEARIAGRLEHPNIARMIGSARASGPSSRWSTSPATTCATSCAPPARAAACPWPRR